jgi:hypothetical protein
MFKRKIAKAGQASVRNSAALNVGHSVGLHLYAGTNRTNDVATHQQPSALVSKQDPLMLAI